MFTIVYGTRSQRGTNLSTGHSNAVSSIKGTQVFHLGPESEHTSCLGAFYKEPMSQKHSSQSSESPLPSKAGGQF